MSDFKVIAPPTIGFQPIADNSTSQKHDLGYCVQANDIATTAYGVGEFMYAKGLAATVVGSVVIIDADDFTTKLAVANDVGRIATAMAATVASEFGWYQCRGKAVAKSLASNADNAAQYLTATAGSIDDAVVAGDRLHKAESASAVDTPSSGLIEIDLDFTFVDNVAD